MSDLSRVTTVILAGGMGTRLRQVVSDRPKVMAEINGKPFLYYLFDQLVDAGIGRVIISTGYMSEKIEETIGSSYKSLQIDFSKEEAPLGTGGALKLAGQFVDTKLCLVMNGDSYVDIDLRDFATWHMNIGGQLSVVIAAVKNSDRFGVVDVSSDGKITDFFEEKQKNDLALFKDFAMNSSEFRDYFNDINQEEIDKPPAITRILSRKLLPINGCSSSTSGYLLVHGFF